MKNTLNDLNNYLFESIERLQNDELNQEELEREIKRSEAVGKTAKIIVDNAELILETKKYFDEFGTGGNVKIPIMIEHDV